MSMNNQDFKEKYRVHPTRVQAINDFKKNNNFSVRKDVRQYMYQVMATIGLELEDRFENYISFDEGGFKLFGREKSEKSIENKRNHNIEEYDKNFQKALKNDDDLPTKVRPIYDFYAFKLVCPEIKNYNVIISKVVLDILQDINTNHPEYSDYIKKLEEEPHSSYHIIFDFIDKYFGNEYSELKGKVLSILNEQQSSEDVQEFLDSTNPDVSTMTYAEYYSKLIECNQILIRLAYEESVEEYVRIAQAGIDAKDTFSEMIKTGKSKQKISEDDCCEYNKKLQELLDHISRKRSNKLDLALGDLIVYDILKTSPKIRELGIKVSEDPTRTKKKRNPNGYIADFYSLDMPNGLTSEIQLQSLYRYTYGENGPAAHNKMENGIKKRTLYPMPTEKLEYKNWAQKQFKALPKYFRYLGHGFVQVFNTLQNFRRYYDTEKPEEVQTYIKYIAEHDVDQLDSDIHRFTLDDVPALLTQPNEPTR